MASRRRRVVLLALVAFTAACGRDDSSLDKGLRMMQEAPGAAAVSACTADSRMIKTAEEAYGLQTDGNYATEPELVPQYLDQQSVLHDVEISVADPAHPQLRIVVADVRCGTLGHEVGQTPTDY